MPAIPGSNQQLPEQNRRLSVVMFLDMVGYSALMSRDEAKAMHHVRALEEILRREVPAAGGRLIKFLGDGSMAEFVTAGSAVACALKIQAAIAASYASDQPQDRYHVRIGLHLGEVTEEKNDLFGDAVNIAARIQPLADPGGIAMSEVVHVQVKNQMKLHGTFLPPVRLKNIPEPVRVFLTCPPGASYLKWRARRHRALQRALAAVGVAASVGVMGWLGVRFLPEWLGPRRVINFPFPQSRSYPHGIKVTRVSPEQAAAEIQGLFDGWRSKYLTRDGAPAGALRVRFDDGMTASSAVADGMLSLVLMDNRRNRTQDQFDALWRYHQSYLDDKGLMNWQVDAAGRVTGSGCNPAAELDVAMALLLAHRQWSNAETSFYLTEARALVEKIGKYCVDPSTHMLKGDSGGAGLVHTGELSPAHCGLIIESGAGDRAFWEEVLRASDGLIGRSLAKYTNGLIPSVCDPNGLVIPNKPSDFMPHSLLVKLGMDFIWFGDRPGRAGRTMLEQVTRFGIQKSGGDVMQVAEAYTLEGERVGAPGVGHAMGAFGVAAMAVESQQTWLNNLYDGMVAVCRSKEHRTYARVWILFEMLAMTGNFPNYWSLVTTKGAPPRVVTFGESQAFGAVADVNVVSASVFVDGAVEGKPALKTSFRKSTATAYCEFWVGIGQDWTAPEGITVEARADRPGSARVGIVDASDGFWACQVRLSATMARYRIPMDSLKWAGVGAPGSPTPVLSNVRSLRIEPYGVTGSVWLREIMPVSGGEEPSAAGRTGPVGLDDHGLPWSYSGNGVSLQWKMEGEAGPDRALSVSFACPDTGFWGVGANVERSMKGATGVRFRAKSEHGSPVLIVVADREGERWSMTLRPAPIFKEYDLPFYLFEVDQGNSPGRNGVMDLDRVQNFQVGGAGKGTDTVVISRLAFVFAGSDGPPSPARAAGQSPPAAKAPRPVDLIGGLTSLAPYSGGGASVKAVMVDAPEGKAMRLQFRNAKDGYWGVPFAPPVTDWKPFKAIAVRVKSSPAGSFRIMVVEQTGESWVALVRASGDSRTVTIPLAELTVRSDVPDARKDGVFDLGAIRDIQIIQPGTSAPGAGTVWIEALELAR